MSAPLFDLRARRAGRPRDSRTIIDNLTDGASSLHAQFCGWPMSFLRVSHIAGAERSLVALERLLAELRTHLPAEPQS